MTIEAELKARVREPERLVTRLAAWAGAPGRVEVYRDVYFDRPGGELSAGGAELRVRTVTGEAGARTVLTYKGAAVRRVLRRLDVADADLTVELYTDAVTRARSRI
ncbi:CYTH domain-containing protein [Kitasatospora sp. NPDC059795]|uniref:CYTH domain-containing protein n=1 Tax=Kitasatospora sp. NPDC059795 TaxID=3346949 RepID=UPI00365314DA